MRDTWLNDLAAAFVSSSLASHQLFFSPIPAQKITSPSPFYLLLYFFHVPVYKFYVLGSLAKKWASNEVLSSVAN